MSGKPKREGPLKMPLHFDEAIRRALKVKPPPEGWKDYERARAKGNRRGPKPPPDEDESGGSDSGPDG